MNRFYIIFNLLIGKDIVIYNSWTKELIGIIGTSEVFKHRYNYKFVDKNDEYITNDAKVRFGENDE